MLQTEELAGLMKQTAQGDQKAFAKLYQSSSAKLFSVCLRIVKEEALAEEVLQEAFVKIWHNANTYSLEKGSPMTWMSSIVRNRALDLLRSKKARPDEVETEYEGLDFASADLGPLELTDVNHSTRAILECLEQLKEKQRECILLAYYYGHTHDELSQRLETPLGTIKAWIRRGMERLRLCLD